MSGCTILRPSSSASFAAASCPTRAERLTLALFYVRERVKAMLAGTTTD